MIGKKRQMHDGTTIEEIAVSEFQIDRDYQRRERDRWVMLTKNKFDPRLLNIGEASRRDDGSLFAIDAQHRVALCKAVGHPSLTVRVHHGLSRQEEASLFRKFNRERSVVGPMDDWKAAIFEQEPEALAIQVICLSHAFKIAKSNKNIDSIGSVKDLRTLYRKKTLDETLALLRFVWGYQEMIGDGRLIAATSLFVERHLRKNRNVTSTKILSAWSKVTPTLIVAEGQKFNGAGGTLTALEVAYNKGRTARQKVGPFVLYEVAA